MPAVRSVSFSSPGEPSRIWPRNSTRANLNRPAINMPWLQWSMNGWPGHVLSMEPRPSSRSSTCTRLPHPCSPQIPRSRPRSNRWCSRHSAQHFRSILQVIYHHANHTSPSCSSILSRFSFLIRAEASVESRRMAWSYASRASSYRLRSYRRAPLLW